ncbi:MAG: hypothetical protein KatS3mg040_0188 [Candidatus Kapaibacterium sp.]|nr:MAG: hypothetical protein KatS3mg040_0188 [Candidatus Kapabacteria bacterium]
MNTFSAIRIEGGILGPDILEQLLGEDLPGQQPKDFGIEGRRSLTEEVARIFTDARSQWEIFQRRLNTLPESDLATSLTRDAWLIPFLSMLGYELDFNHRAYLVEGETFAISHRAGKHPDAPPVHCVGARQELGRLAPSGRPRLSPHGLLQEFLNRTEHLWGLVTNGRILRCLRDSTFVRRQAYIEFDLEQIFEQQLFTDFTILYRLLHRTRLPRSAEDAHDCLLEQYHAASLLQGGRVRDRLRDGVEECIKRLANGFLAHPDNGKLRAQMANSEWQIEDQTETPLAIRHSLFAQDFYRQLLRLVYRFLFLLVSEDRGLISDDPNYRSWYSISRLRHLCERRSAYTDHDDLWCSLRVLWNVLADERLAPMLGTAPLNGELFAELTLDNCTITNADLLGALWHLVFYRESPTQPLRRVNYAALDVEELGSVYESLLEYHPVIVASDEQRAASGEWRVGGGWRFDLVYGSERKSTGSYYTPPELVAELIRSALEPVIEERLEHAERAASSEWRTVKETLVQLFGENHAHTFVSRLGSLAESNGAGRRSLSHHERLSEGGTLRTDQPDAPSSNIGPGEHRRGMGAAGDEGISAIPEHRLRQPAGAGNLPDAGSTDQPDNTSAGRATAGLGAYVGQTTHRTPAQPLSEEQIAHLWNSLPLANRRSLLAEQCLLSIRVLDPACGSGHFLLAAARRLGKELARIRTGEDEPSPERTREAIRDVVAHCIYGVDKNPLAVELCRVALWLEAHSPGKPLTFLDHRIRCGDSLVGVLDLGELERGIPDEAFAPASTDAKDTASLLKKRNRTERRDLERGQLVFSFDSRSAVSELARQHAELDAIPDDTPAHVKEKQRRYDTARHSPLAIRQLQACNLWTAAFFQPLASSKQRAVEGRAGSGEQRAVEDTTDELLTARQSPLAESERLAARQSPLAKSSPLAFITTDTLRRYLESGSAHPQALAIAEALAVHNRFFHWPLEFPEVFLPSPTGRGAGGEGLLPSPTGRGAGGEGNPPQPKRPLPDDLLHFARQLRRNLTDAEKLLWMLLRGRQFGGWKFRRQHPMPPYVLDFYCHELRLAIELDGGQHNTPEQLHYDQQRSEYLAAKGINVLRFWNNQVLQETEAVLHAIWNEAIQRQQQLGQQPESLTLTLSPRERESSSPLPPGEGPVGEGILLPHSPTLRLRRRAGQSALHGGLENQRRLWRQIPPLAGVRLRPLRRHGRPLCRLLSPGLQPAQAGWAHGHGGH